MKKNNFLVIGLAMISTILVGCSVTKNIETETPTIPENCSNWFDGCNNCFVQSGQIAWCTRMACETMEEAKCTEFKTMDPSWDLNKDQINDCEKDWTCDDSIDYTLPKQESVETWSWTIETKTPTVPENCTAWFDGCNNCMVESGQVTACTMMYCETPTEAKCTQFK